MQAQPLLPAAAISSTRFSTARSKTCCRCASGSAVTDFWPALILMMETFRSRPKLTARAKSSCETGRNCASPALRKNSGRTRPEQPGASPWAGSSVPKIKLHMLVAWVSGSPQSGGIIDCRTLIEALRRSGWVRSGRPSTTPILTPGEPEPASASATRILWSVARERCDFIYRNYREHIDERPGQNRRRYFGGRTICMDVSSRRRPMPPARSAGMAKLEYGALCRGQS
jgi:hypothetical protein